MVRKNEVIAASWEKGISNMYKTTKYDAETIFLQVVCAL